MDEAVLREQICQAAAQLWMRGLIVGDGGLISVECHRKRFLVTPQRGRRSALSAADPVVVDVGGVSLNGQAGIDDDVWLPHRLAYQNHAQEMNGHDPLMICAAITATPPMLMALMRLEPQAQVLELPTAHPVPVVSLDDEPRLRAALKVAPVVALRSVGAVSIAENLTDALNAIERAEHAATIEIASRR